MYSAWLRTISHIQVVLVAAADAAAAADVNQQHRTPDTLVTVTKLRCTIHAPVCRLSALQSRSNYNMLKCHTELNLYHAKIAHIQPSPHDRTQHNTVCMPM